MEALEKQLEDLLAQIVARRTEARRLSAEEADLAISEPEKAIAAGDRAASTRRLLPRLEAEFKKFVARKVAEDIEASSAAIDEKMESDLAAQAASYPALVEALRGMVNPFNALAAARDFRRLRRQFDFLSPAPWADLMKNINTILDEWKKEDRRSAESLARAEKDRAKGKCEHAGGNLLAELALLAEDDPVMEGAKA